jgi:hypothetical protein
MVNLHLGEVTCWSLLNSETSSSTIDHFVSIIVRTKLAI